MLTKDQITKCVGVIEGKFTELFSIHEGLAPAFTKIYNERRGYIMTTGIDFYVNHRIEVNHPDGVIEAVQVSDLYYGNMAIGPIMNDGSALNYLNWKDYGSSAAEMSYFCYGDCCLEMDLTISEVHRRIFSEDNAEDMINSIKSPGDVPRLEKWLNTINSALDNTKKVVDVYLPALEKFMEIKFKEAKEWESEKDAKTLALFNVDSGNGAQKYKGYKVVLEEVEVK